MGRLTEKVRRLLCDNKGPTVAECALFVAFVVLFYVAVTRLIGR